VLEIANSCKITTQDVDLYQVYIQAFLIVGKFYEEEGQGNQLKQTKLVWALG
jgi:hypothetical protein